MNNTDFTFMKSGFDNSPLDEDDMKKNIASILVHFMENALKSAAIYVKHCKRNVVTIEDIKRGMMLEAFLFGRRTDTGEKVEAIKREIFGEEVNSDDEEEVEFAEDIDDDEDNVNIQNIIEGSGGNTGTNTLLPLSIAHDIVNIASRESSGSTYDDAIVLD